MAPKFVLAALVSVLVLLASPIPSKVSAATTGPTNYTSIAIGGEILCSKLSGAVDFQNASPVNGAIVRVSCFDKNWKLISASTGTNSGGYFFLPWKNVKDFDPSRCLAYVDWSPVNYCNVPLYLPGTHGSRLYLVDVKPVPGGQQAAYSPGVIYLGPPTGAICPKK